jgi:hypothetical protein
MIAEVLALPAWRLAVDVGLAVLSWLVQLVIYPAFAAIARPGFCAWHAGYTRRISVVVVPLMLGQFALHAMALWRAPSWLGGLQALLLAVAWAATFLVAVPCHRRLGGAGCEPPVLRRLLRANAVRTAAWTLVAGISAGVVLAG